MVDTADLRFVTFNVRMFKSFILNFIYDVWSHDTFEFKISILSCSFKDRIDVLFRFLYYCLATLFVCFKVFFNNRTPINHSLDLKRFKSQCRARIGFFALLYAAFR